MKIDNFFYGLVLGAVTPTIAYGISQSNFANIDLGEKQFSYYIVAALVNLLLVRYFYRNDRSNSARGIILITFIAALAAIFLKDVTVSY